MSPREAAIAAAEAEFAADMQLADQRQAERQQWSRDLWLSDRDIATKTLRDHLAQIDRDHPKEADQ